MKAVRLCLRMAPAVLAMACLAPPVAAMAADPEEAAGVPESLKERVEAYWQAKVDYDAEGAYAFLSPGYRETTPLARYRRQLNSGVVRWTDAEVAQKGAETECGRDRCEVRVRIRYIYQGAMSHMNGQEVVSHVTERWVKIQGKWWYVPE